MALDRWFRVLRLRARSLLGGARLDQELDEELALHVEELAAQIEARGVPGPEARRQALAAMGGLGRRREEMRDARGFGALEDLGRDARHAVRALRRTPGFTAVASLTLALGIAAATTVFSLVDAAMLRPPPFAGADRLGLLTITQRTPAAGELHLRWSWPRFQMLERHATSFAGLASSFNAVVTLTGAGDPEPLPIEIVSSRYLQVMGASVVLGTGLGDYDDRPDAAEPRVILGYGLWQERFGGAPDVVGRVVVLNDVPLRVAGVVEPGFAGLSGRARAWLPAAVAPSVVYREYFTSGQHFLTVVGRRQDGVTAAMARAELERVGALVHDAFPVEAETSDDIFGVAFTSVNEARVDGTTRRALLILAGAVGVLFLIACANVASLLLGRAVGRQKEIGIRLALGAGRRRLIRQLLVESGILAILACALGLALAWWALVTIRIPATLMGAGNFYGAVGEFTTPVLDWRVVTFASAIAMGTVLVSGLIPALRATRTDLVGELKAGGVIAGAGRRFGLREGVVATQLALSIVLLAGCGLLLASYTRLRETPLGFEPERLLTFMIRPSEVRYDAASAPALLDRVLAEIGQIPGVESASVDGCAPLSMQCARAFLQVVGRPWPAGRTPPSVSRHYVGPDHFRVLGVPVLRGRGLTPGDRAGRPAVVVINEAAATRFWPDQNPIGQRVWFDGATALGSVEASAEIVGVVGDAAYYPLDETPIRPGFFSPYAQFTYASRMILVRSVARPLDLVPSIREAVRRADPSLALFDVQTMTERAQLSWSKHRFQTTLVAVIAALALALAVVGVHAVMACYVAGRQREIGTRMALGATDLQVMRDTASQTARIGLVGGVGGVIGALAMSQVLRASLYQTSPLDPGVFLWVAVVLLAALVLAGYLPVRRALQVTPMEVLRAE